MARLFIFFFLFTAQAFAQYENDALDQALVSHFSSIESVSSVIYTETDKPYCSLEANLEVTGSRYGTSQVERFECDVCLYADDNLFWDYESIECEFAAH